MPPSGQSFAQPGAIPSAEQTEEARWFEEQVQPHDAQLKAYLRNSFPAVRDVDDIVQEAYLRVLKARTAQPIQSAKAFLFKVARHLALDLLRHHRKSPINSVGHLDGLGVIEDRPDAAELASRQEKIRLLAEGISRLPNRCREIFLLHKIQGLSRREVALKLGLSEKTVEVQTARAMDRCGIFLRKHGVNGLSSDERR